MWLTLLSIDIRASFQEGEVDFCLIWFEAGYCRSLSQYL